MRKDSTFSDVVDALRKTYTNMDIRALIGRENSTAEWQCIFLKVRLTDDSNSRIESIYSEKVSKLTPNINCNFRLIAICKAIDQLDTILSGIDGGIIMLGKESIRLRSENPTRVRDLTVLKYGATYEQGTNLDHWFTFHHNAAGRSTIFVAENLGFSKQELGIDFSRINHWFDIPYDSWNGTSIHVLILFPIYIRRIKFAETSRNCVLVYQIHNNLLGSMKPPRVKVEYKSGEVIAEDKKLKIISEGKREVHDRMVSRSINIEHDQLLELLNIEIWFIHRRMDILLFTDEIDQDKLAKGKEEVLLDDEGTSGDELNRGLEGSHNIKRDEKTKDYLTRPQLARYLHKIEPHRALDRITHYLREIERLRKLPYAKGESQMGDLDHKIKAFITVAFDNPEDRTKKYDNHVNAAFLVVGKTKTAIERKADYLQDLREMETMLLSYKEEFEIIGQANVYPEKTHYDSNSIFIVHGHDNVSKLELARMIESEFKLKSIILDEQADEGRTIIEKLEGVAELPGYAIVLFTPDDIGGENGKGIDLDDPKTSGQKIKDLKVNLRYRARQNVILELGYFYARLGRNRVCCLYKKGIELPSDISGVIYKEFVKSVREKETEIRRELIAAGYQINQS